MSITVFRFVQDYSILEDTLILESASHGSKAKKPKGAVTAFNFYLQAERKRLLNQTEVLFRLIDKQCIFY
jgi:hypothetical protein